MKPKSKTPTGFQNTAQGCAAGATLGNGVHPPGPSPAQPGEPRERIPKSFIHVGNSSITWGGIPNTAIKTIGGRVIARRRIATVYMDRKMRIRIKRKEDARLISKMEPVHITCPTDPVLNGTWRIVVEATVSKHKRKWIAEVTIRKCVATLRRSKRNE